MSTIYEIPLSGQAQTFNITLGTVSYQFTLKWNTASNCWILDIADDAGDAILSGIPLVTGADLLEQFTHLGIGGGLYVQTDGNVQAVPTFTNLGTDSHLYLVVA